MASQKRHYSPNPPPHKEKTNGRMRGVGSAPSSTTRPVLCKPTSGGLEHQPHRISGEAQQASRARPTRAPAQPGSRPHTRPSHPEQPRLSSGEARAERSGASASSHCDAPAIAEAASNLVTNLNLATKSSRQKPGIPILARHLPITGNAAGVAKRSRRDKPTPCLHPMPESTPSPTRDAAGEAECGGRREPDPREHNPARLPPMARLSPRTFRPTATTAIFRRRRRRSAAKQTPRAAAMQPAKRSAAGVASPGSHHNPRLRPRLTTERAR
jgi:hypothetical protein